jgi:hypothetical protein
MSTQPSLGVEGGPGRPLPPTLQKVPQIAAPARMARAHAAGTDVPVIA